VPRLRRLNIQLHRDHAFEATRVAIDKDRLVYILVADKRLRYTEGESRIAYIGTTGGGPGRVAQSVAQRAPEILCIRGVRKFHARIVSCQPRQNVKTWHLLERALLLEFKEMHGEEPWCNVQGKRMRERDEFRYFTRSRVRGILRDLR
jgi:hypothetical protein